MARIEAPSTADAAEPANPAISTDPAHSHTVETPLAAVNETPAQLTPDAAPEIRRMRRRE